MAASFDPIQHGPAARAFALLCVAVPLALLAWVVTWWAPVTAGQELVWSVAWVPSLGVDLAFRVDGLALLFAGLISGIGALILLYATSYMQGHPQRGWFLGYLLAFLLSMFGLVLADDLIVLFVFWELTTITSFLLIGFDNHRERARWAARQALFVTGAGGLVMLIGIILIGQIGGTYTISELDGDLLRGHALYPVIVVLILAGCFTKSAQFPFHGWLPNAMEGPTPVSAFLHSATMVKGGIYLMARLNPELGGTELWTLALVTFGAITAVLASIWSLRETDYKQVLAYTTLMALGTLTLFIGIGGDYAITGMVTFILVHALYKAGLFMTVGIVDHETGTREESRLGGLARQMPVTAGAAVLLALSMAGMIPFIGFVGKELLYKGTEAFTPNPWTVIIPALLANAMMVTAALHLARDIFFGRKRETFEKAHDPDIRMWLGPVLLALGGLALGFAGAWLEKGVLGAAALSVAGEPSKAKILLWAGVNQALYLSIATIALGLVLYFGLGAFRTAMAGLGRIVPVTFDGVYNAKIAVIERASAWLTALLQPGLLRVYVMVTFGFTGIVLLTVLAGAQAPAFPSGWESPRFYEWVVVGLIVAATIVLLQATSRLVAITSMGIIGASIGILYLLFSAPDLAITQLLVETLSVIIITVVILRLPSFLASAHPPGAIGRLRDALVAVSAGSAVTLMLLGVVALPFDPFIADYFAAVSYPEAFGRNIVNVIIVDFRALDTLGEIVVVGVAALAIFGLIKLRPGRSRDEEGGAA